VAFHQRGVCLVAGAHALGKCQAFLAGGEAATYQRLPRLRAGIFLLGKGQLLCGCSQRFLPDFSQVLREQSVFIGTFGHRACGAAGTQHALYTLYLKYCKL